MGKNILIIGASGGIGQAIAIELANDGHQLVLHYHTNHAAIEHIMKHVDPLRILSTIQSDLTIDGSAEQLVASVPFSMDAVVFSGGETQFGLFQDVLETDMNKMLTLHVKSPWIITKDLLPGMIQKRAGNIIFITSIWGEHGASMEVIYSSVKGAQQSFVKALSKELSESGISVQAISPGLVDTKMNAHFSKEEKQVLFDDIPLRRAGKPEDIAKTVRFLINDTANVLGNNTIHVDGGWEP